MRGNRRAVNGVNARDGDAVVHGPAVGPPVGRNPCDGAHACGDDRLAARLPGPDDGRGDLAPNLALHLAWLVLGRAAVRVGARQLQPVARDAGGGKHLGCHLLLEPRVHVQQVGNHQRNGCPVIALSDKRPRIERVVDPRGAAGPSFKPVHLVAERRGDLHAGRTSLHQAAPPRGMARPVRSDS